jgi:dynein heavy chain
LLKQAGSKLIPTLFLISDTQVLKESYLEDISNILNSGEVSNIMTQEDNEEIHGDLK